MRIKWQVWLLALLMSVPAWSSPSESKQSLQALQAKLESLKQAFERTQGEHAEAVDALKSSEQAISEANHKLQDILQQQKSSATKLDQLHHDQNKLQKSITEQQKVLNEQLINQYVAGEQNYLRTLLEEENPNAVARNLHYFGYIARARAKQISDLQHNLGQLSLVDVQTQATLQEITELKALQLQQKEELQRQQAERKSVLVRLATQLKSQRSEISRLERDEKRLSELVARLARILPPSKVQRRMAKQPNVKPNAKTPEQETVNEALPEFETASADFASLQGKLRLPVKGVLANHFGTPREESGVLWKGLFIKSDEGSDVHAVASGRVVFADWLRGFGNLMIVDHGKGYMSLYGNNQTLLKRAGDEVNTGDVIAAVGNTGGNPVSGLYFELRKESKPFDPLAWCVLR